jgi:hypothetical protein
MAKDPSTGNRQGFLAKGLWLEGSLRESSTCTNSPKHQWLQEQAHSWAAWGVPLLHAQSQGWVVEAVGSWGGGLAVQHPYLAAGSLDDFHGLQKRLHRL